MRSRLPVPALATALGIAALLSVSSPTEAAPPDARLFDMFGLQQVGSVGGGRHGSGRDDGRLHLQVEAVLRSGASGLRLEQRLVHVPVSMCGTAGR